MEDWPLSRAKNPLQENYAKLLWNSDLLEKYKSQEVPKNYILKQVCSF